MIRVLVVDDEKLVRQGIISSLPWGQFDMQVVGEAKNGEKAIEFLEQQEADLMLTDLAMPVMSGIELMRIVRKRYPHLYIIVLTLHQDFEYIQEALRIGAIDYIAKVELVQDRFYEILARIHERIKEEERKKGGQSGGLAIRETVEADHGYPMHSSGTQSDSIRDIAEAGEQWSAIGWIHNDERFAAHLHRLKSMELPEPELMRFLVKLTDEWNALFGLVPTDRLNIPEAFNVWSEVEDWFRQTRKALSRTLDAPHYSQEVQDAIMKAVQLIQEQLNGQMYAADIAKRVNLSRSYFSQCFRDIIGKSFKEYVRQARVDKAKEYLMHTNKPILWIAEKTGYLDGKYFSTVFRDQTGLLPSAFRKTHHQESDK